MEKIVFSYNWNNKLNCKVFTSFRIFSEKYKVGEIKKIFLKDEYLFDAQIISVKKIKVIQVNEFIAGIDTGYSVEEFIEIIKKMYKDKDINSIDFCLILFKKI